MWVVHCKTDAFDVYVGRPSLWGNPFSHREGTIAKWRAASRAEAIRKHEEWVRSQPAMVREIKRQLKGKVLGCWCAPRGGIPARYDQAKRICHAETLAVIANEED